jgi:hypothetical protein
MVVLPNGGSPAYRFVEVFAYGLADVDALLLGVCG